MFDIFVVIPVGTFVLKYSVAHQVIVLLFTIDQYMAFGISGDDTRTFMVGADVVVTWVDEDGPEAVDYYLTGRVQVSYIYICLL